MPLTYFEDSWSEVHILEATDEAIKENGFAYGASFIKLTDEHINALKEGKALSWTDGEYMTYVLYSKE